MTDFLRILLLLVIAGCVITAAASWTAWWLEEERRLNRMIRRCLGGEPDAAIIAHGRNAAAAISLDADQALVLANGGAQSLLYPLSALMGAELTIDGVVAARAFRGEPRKPLDAINAEARHVRLRLIFDNPRDPDFELELWPPAGHPRHDKGPAAAIQEARTWLARAEAILRRPVSVAKVTAQGPVEDDDEDEAPF